MRFDLCVGNGETFLEFQSEEERDRAFSNMKVSYNWKSDWAEKVGARQIMLYPDKIPIAYRWRARF